MKRGQALNVNSHFTKYLTKENPIFGVLQSLLDWYIYLIIKKNLVFLYKCQINSNFSHASKTKKVSQIFCSQLGGRVKKTILDLKLKQKGHTQKITTITRF